MEITALVHPLSQLGKSSDAVVLQGKCKYDFLFLIVVIIILGTLLSEATQPLYLPRVYCSLSFDVTFMSPNTLSLM